MLFHILPKLRFFYFFFRKIKLLRFFVAVCPLCVVNVYNQEFKPFFDNYTVNNGLSDNYIDCVFQDYKGWIWIGNRVGVERFDGIKFKNYNLFIDDTTQIEGLLVRDFFEDSQHILYVCYEEHGLAYYNRSLDRFESMKIVYPGFKENLTAKDVVEDPKGNLWIATKNGILKFDPKKSKLKRFTADSDDGNSLIDNYVRKLAIDNNGSLWVGTRSGIDIMDLTTQQITPFSNEKDKLKDDILDIYIDKQNRKWIGTANNGALLIDSLGYVKTINLNPTDLRCRKVKKIYQSRNGELWFGTRGGLYILNEKEHSIKQTCSNDLEKNSLVHSSILDISEDENGEVWIGTRGGLSYLAEDKQPFTHYKSIPGNRHYLNNAEIYCAWFDGENVWLGTEKGGINILNKKSGTFTYLTNETPNGLSSNCIKSIQALGEREILIGTFKGGLNIYNRQTKKITCFTHDPKKRNSLSGNIVWDIAIDQNNRIWLATDKGLDLFDPKEKSFYHDFNFVNEKPVSCIEVDNNNDIWIGSDIIKIFRPGTGIIQTIDLEARDFLMDSQNRCWVATEDRGLVLCDKFKGIVKQYDKTSGIASNLTFCIEQDKKGCLWISTTNGLSKFDVSEEKFDNYYKRDGLQSNQFYYGASCCDDEGYLYFGGINGLTAFNPLNIVRSNYIPPVYFTDLKIFNKSVEISSNRDAILKSSITETNQLNIPYKSNVITLEFAALNYTNSNKNHYKYMLEGFDKTWRSADESRSATYTNLSPGKYMFRVIASNNNDVWNEEGASLNLYIRPMVYQTIWFKFFLLLIIITASYFIIRVILKRRDLQRDLEFEKEKAQKLHELDLFKLKFFTNISHEIKTPLTLIISPLKKMLREGIAQPDVQENLIMMERHAENLMNLITQLLDFRKLQNGKLNLNLKSGDLVRFSKTTFESFKDLMEERHISYSFESVLPHINTCFDPDKLKKILNNLISNAIKHTRNGGEISLLISMVIEKEDQQSNRKISYAKIELEDTGIGMDEDTLAHIFKRYFNKSNDDEVNSWGIGLAYTKELIDLHQGKISVESTVDKGSLFTVMLPVVSGEENEEQTVKEEKVSSIEFIKTKSFEEAQKSKKVILVVDDNKDIVSFLTDHLKEKYLVLNAYNGLEGAEIAINAVPDLVIADVMMPELDGRELCKKIKSDNKTSHIPVILLSALDSDKNQLKGIESGADEYISKPFDVQILHKKIENLILLAERLKNRYSKKITLMPSNVTVSSPDEVFLNNLLRTIEKEIDNTELDVDMLAQCLNISRMQLYRKVSALTNMTVKELVTDIRLKRAAQLLSKQKLSVSEVVYSVGFNDLSYFGKCFKKKYGINPSEYNKSLQKSDCS